MKDIEQNCIFCWIIVAPLVGAWIESYMNLCLLKQKQVAPLVGAWIESDMVKMVYQSLYVAPLVGAWIERRETG